MEEIIEAFVFHKHPLRRIPKEEAAGTWNWCSGCGRYFLPGEAIYGCSRSDCGSKKAFHQECLEMPREIRHHVHPSHTLTLRGYPYEIDRNSKCAVCEWYAVMMMYSCSGGCELRIHMGCAVGFEDVGDEDEKQAVMEHPSHPRHPLRLSKKTRLLSFPCDACGTSTDKGNSYICSICDYWIHESCASLPPSVRFPHHPHHSLSLAFHPTSEYIRFEFVCDICSGALRLRNWVYHCQLCRYVVHIKCATDTSLVAPSISSNNENTVDDEKDVIRGPISDIYEEIIRPFIKRERGEILIPHEEDGKYKFHNHLLKFTRFSTRSSSSSFHDHNKEEEKEEDDDDDDDDNIPRSELTCDGCTLPIHEKKYASSSTSCSHDEYDNGYMSCDECKYFLHLACFNLPLELFSLPLHPITDHKVMLRNSSKLTNWIRCDSCHGYTNGLFYKCTDNMCSFKIDIKCASLPSTIKHVGHPQRHHYLKLVIDNRSRGFCGACYKPLHSTKSGFYKCDSCFFGMCGECVLLPAHNKHRLENHCLSLTYDAYCYHSGDFYCGNCEGQMNLKRWMYHCRDCDQSFHTRCFPATSGRYRNMNFGRQQYVTTTIDHNPNHLLRFQIISKKKRCDLCHGNAYDKPGLQCASCNFVISLHPSRKKHINDFKAID